jgi:transposase InsO family protein
MSDYKTYEDVLASIPYFIEEAYNKKRLHFSPGYISPEEFEYKFNKKKSLPLFLI